MAVEPTRSVTPLASDRALQTTALGGTSVEVTAAMAADGDGCLDGDTLRSAVLTGSEPLPSTTASASDRRNRFRYS